QGKEKSQRRGKKICPAERGDVIRAGAGLAKGDAAEAGREAARRAAADLSRVDLAFVFTSSLDLEDAALAVSAASGALGDARIVGCNGGGVVSTGEEVEGEPAVSIVAVEARETDLAVEPFSIP